MIQTNCHCFLKILQTLRFFGRQVNDIESNFYQLLKLKSLRDKMLKGVAREQARQIQKSQYPNYKLLSLNYSQFWNFNVFGEVFSF